ncbi:MAG: colanic acid biosynthesis glycosyltransferase WcaL [Acidiphilium sp. 37-64-53]|uniref:glycosyltransferase n=1 Tax=Acidiphilium TaxID=522 RepID=UPI000BD57477|nr:MULTISPECIES: glycosyltransferase [Acidiphilium]OYW01319.1 MAG: colanic acid biosynthesis glycosyltransferase WcaL [Acidiphilium sp. 37-64-53]OZB28889.1 MAG: colanic acid biosynthesis glycosyltransferase WcaL [Acidiphilium sp. 34-64-41]HQT85983.1 glycosyltransferase [Acidiphilium rubrum]
MNAVAAAAMGAGPVAYIMKRYPRLTETFILNEIRAMERLGADLRIFSLLPPEPPPHHPMVAEVRAPVRAVPMAGAWVDLLRAHGAAIRTAPLRYAGAFGRAAWWSVQSPTPLSVWKQFTRAGFVATACRRDGIRHIHAHFANAPAAVARFASLMSGIPFSFTAHAKDLYLTPKQVISRRARAASFVATCTGYNAQYLRDLLGAAESHKINLVYHGIDLTHFSARAAIGAAIGAAPIPLVLSVGRLVPKKGHDDLIEACALLRDAGVAFRCMIVGAGPLHAELAALIERHDLAGTVTLEGAMTHAALIDLYRRATLFALAPRIADDGDRDGIPNVIAEAMAIGVPVVSTDVSGIPEVVRDGETGRLVPPRDARALADAMGRLLADPDQAQALAAAARALLERDFDLWTTTTRLHGLMGCADCAPAGTGLVCTAPAVAAAG